MCVKSSNHPAAKASYGFRAALWDARSSALTRRIKSSVALCWLSRRFASASIFWFKSSSAAATRDSRGKAMSISFATIGDLRRHRSAFYCTVPVLGLPSLSSPCAIHACSCMRSKRSVASLIQYRYVLRISFGEVPTLAETSSTPYRLVCTA